MTTTSIPEPETNQVSRRGLILAVLLAGAFMILLDATIVNVAVPRIQTGLHATYASVEWVIGGYALAYGLMLIPVGRLGDRIGHKPVLIAGLAGFTITSLLCGTAQSPGQLVGWRVLQGVMAGVLNPPVLALIQSVFPPRERGKAFAAYGATAGVSADGAAGRLVRCFHTQANAPDPTVTPPNCRIFSNDSVPFKKAASAALKDNFGRAVQIGSLYALGAIVLTFGLVFVLPRRRAAPPEW